MDLVVMGVVGAALLLLARRMGTGMGLALTLGSRRPDPARTEREVRRCVLAPAWSGRRA